MRKLDNQVIYSPTDLVRFMNSPFASYLQRQYLESPESLLPDPEDETLAIAAQKGNEFESQYFDRLKEQSIEVRTIEGVDTLGQTRRAIEEGVECIYQGHLRMDRFQGYADFMFRDNNASGIAYEIHDTKFAHNPKPSHVVQLCCYAEMLHSMTDSLPNQVAIVTGTGEVHRFRVEEYYAYYINLKNRFLELMDMFPGDGSPEPVAGADHGRWASYADTWFVERDHLSLVANIRASQIQRLEDKRIRTAHDLAHTEVTHIKGIGDETLKRLKQQARLQQDSKELDAPLFEILPQDPENPLRGLASLPPLSEGDVYFDFEGDPFSPDGGLEYLFGAVIIENNQPQFLNWWAHNETQEKEAFETFVDWAMERWKKYPGMHIYHYAPYETTALKRLMGKYGTREEEIDTFLRNGLLVDLYSVVRHSVAVGEPAYSIKNMEHLYMERTGEVTDAGASIVYYERWRESGQPEDWQNSSLLKDIRDYNEVDCVSTWKLTLWLRTLQQEQGLSWYKGEAEPEEDEQPLEGARFERQELAMLMLAKAEAMPEHPADDKRVTQLLAYLLEFHRRAQKPMWWKHFELLGALGEAHFDDPECIEGLVLTGSPVKVKRSTDCWYSFPPDQETKLNKGSGAYILYAPPIRVKIEEFDYAGKLCIRIGPSALKQMPNGEPMKTITLIPDNAVPTATLEKSIQEVATEWHENNSLRPALHDFLFRVNPRIKSVTQKNILVGENEDLVEASLRLISDMDSSCVCIQGPPGTGKTYTAAAVIGHLLNSGKRVGITSNSHKAINNLLSALAKAGVEQSKLLKVGGSDEDPIFDKYPGIQYSKSSAQGAEAYSDGVIGGTAWLFSRDELTDALDYLFIDEAGQVSIANLVANAHCASNIVLMGDQMQLPQPVEGTHPGESGSSILDYYLEGHATIPPDRGIFLNESWRMHPNICNFISKSIYENRLHARPHTVNRIVEVPQDAQLVTSTSGLVFLPVKHKGNVQSSKEEVEAILALTKELLGRVHTDDEGNPAGPITSDDILYVSPYNAQVNRLKAALPDEARVGSVDKFQGQEAPIVIVSMCASPGEFGSRGMSFVFDKNRLNVAISRAQSLAIIVADPGLALTPANTIDNMQRVSLFASVLDYSESKR